MVEEHLPKGHTIVYVLPASLELGLRAAVVAGCAAGVPVSIQSTACLPAVSSTGGLTGTLCVAHLVGCTRSALNLQGFCLLL